MGSYVVTYAGMAQTRVVSRHGLEWDRAREGLGARSWAGDSIPTGWAPERLLGRVHRGHFRGSCAEGYS